MSAACPDPLSPHGLKADGAVPGSAKPNAPRQRHVPFRPSVRRPINQRSMADYQRPDLLDAFDHTRAARLI